MSVSLSKPVDLTNTRAIAAGAMLAYATEELQAVKNLNAGQEGERCSYVGPCAIGVNIDEQRRERWDGWDSGQSIFTIIRDGEAIGDEDALTDLQAAHDRFAKAPFLGTAHLNFLIVTTFYAMGLDK